MDQRWSLQTIVLGADLRPERREELEVSLELFFRAALARGADDEASGERAFVFLNDIAQAQALSSEEILRETPM